MKRLADFSVKHPLIVVITVILITFVAVYFARGVTMTTDIKDFFPEDDPRVMTYDHVEEIYGSGEYIMVALETDDVFNQRTLENIDRLSREFEEFQGVSSVQSLTAIDDIKGVDGDLKIEPLVDEIPEDEVSMQRLKDDVLGDRMYGGFIVSEDSQATLIISEVNPDYDSLAVADEIGEIVAGYEGHERIYLTGTPVLNNVLAESMQADLKFLVPLVLVMIGLILWFVFKSFRGILLPFASVGFSLVWTVGFMGLLNKDFSPLNAVMPVILISLGTAFGIFILKRYYEEMGSGLKSEVAVIASITSVGVAVLMAGGTTAAGFASNLLSDITLIQEFGLFTGFGVLAALFISLTFIPAVISLLGEGKTREFNERSKIGEMLIKAIDRPKLIIGLTAIILILSLAGLPRIEIDSNFFNFFAEDSEPRIAYDFVRDKFSGSESVEIIIEGYDVTEPEILQSMEAFQKELYETGMVGRPTSLTDIISKTNLALQTGEGDNYYVPDSGNLISQYLLLIEMNDSDYLERFLTFEEDGARIQALVQDTSGSEIDRLMSKIDDLGAKHFGDQPVEITSTGIIVLIDALAEMIIEGQLSSIITALIAVFFIVYLLLKSWQGSILSVVLVGFLTVLNFGIMGWAGIKLDVVTVLISSIGIGVGVDYAIMVYARYLEEKKKGLQVREAVVRTVETIGSAIMSNAIAVISGFIILIFSYFPPFRFFGILVTTLMLAAAVGSILVMPAVILQIEKIRR
ncbi:RND family transporter [Halanaerobiaceae bacterium Z-7014]|uniref:RND family transporter n=1 Tax=Halonatronomonas betaini TaxID=2778430 RepID=A0A931AP84_9FIRM|nr:MMPL family transporter [Halonatronomonas betaini]MBF8436443.1 RND family transporter [Halonatronomonas betaini]